MSGNIYDFTLTLLTHGTNYLARAECPLAGEIGPSAIAHTDIANLSLVGERLARGDVGNIAEVAQIGRGLYHAVFRDGIDDLLQRALAVAIGQSAGLRIVLKFPYTPELHGIPWEILHDGRQFLLLNPATPIIRYTELASEVRPIESQSPLRILFTTASPTDAPSLDLAADERNMRAAVAGLGDLVELVVEKQITLERLRNVLMRAQNRDRPFQIWQHVGHGQLLRRGEAPTFALVLEDANRDSHPVDIARISALVKGCPSLRAVVLETCHGASPIGLAPALASLNVPAVLGFRGAVSVEIAHTFMKAFYEAVPQRSIDVAFGHACIALAATSSHPTAWTLPLLLLRTTHPLFLTPPVAKKSTDAAQPQASAGSSAQGSSMMFKGNVRAKRATIIAIANVGDKAPAVQPNIQFEFDPQSFETEDLLQIGLLSIASPTTPGEALDRLDDLRHIAWAISQSVDMSSFSDEQ